MYQLSLRRFLSFTLVFSLLFANAAFAASLTNRQIESFINSMDALNEQMPDIGTGFSEEPDYDDENFDFDAYYAQIQEEMNAMMAEFNMNKMATFSVQEVKKTEHFALFSRIIAEHGFRNSDDWAALGDRIFAAYFANEMNEQFATEGLSAEELDMMRAYLGDMMAGLEDVPKEDIRAITPYLDRLNVLMDDGEDDLDSYYDGY